MGTKFAENLRAARIKERRTASQCAEAIGCTVAAWSQWESGKREPKYTLLLDICLMLNTTPNVLLGFEVPPLRDSAPPRETKIRTGDNSPVAIGTNIIQTVNQPKRKGKKKDERQTKDRAC